jgi:RHS repeat-associated protein
VATNVTINSSNAAPYGDATFAATNTPVVTNYTAIAADKYGRHSTNTVTVSIATNTTYQYDGNGNLTNDGLRTFAYDDENQLLQVWGTNQWLSQFAYDGKMRRRTRQEFTWQNGAWLQINAVYYVYDGNTVMQERNVNNLPTTTYTRGLDLSASIDGAGGIGGLQAMTSNTALGPASLAYYLYRYYDPNLQRWPNRDPLGESGGINLFQFNGNNPLRYIDSDGFIIVVAQNLPCSFYTNLNNAINRLWNSPTGSNLLQRALNSTNIIYITQAPDSVLSCEDGDPGDPTNTIYLNNYPDLINPNGPILDPDQFPPASEMPPYDSTGGSIVLAHELGHTIVGPDDFQNILLFENPVRSDLGLLPRTNCHGKPIPNPQ